MLITQGARPQTISLANHILSCTNAFFFFFSKLHDFDPINLQVLTMFYQLSLVGGRIPASQVVGVRITKFL